jgi:branched-chain amino acid aminotransferase
MQVVERSIDRSGLFLAYEIFPCGTEVQIVPVTRIDHRLVGTGQTGPGTRVLREDLFALVRGR